MLIPLTNTYHKIVFGLMISSKKQKKKKKIKVQMTWNAIVVNFKAYRGNISIRFTQKAGPRPGTVGISYLRVIQKAHMFMKLHHVPRLL